VRTRPWDGPASQRQVWVGHRPGRARLGMGVGAIGAFGSISGNASSDEIQGSNCIMHMVRRAMPARDPHNRPGVEIWTDASARAACRPAHMRKGSTSFGACEVRCWRWLFGNKIPVSLHVGQGRRGPLGVA